MKLKKLMEGLAWEREPGKPLPTLKDVAGKHQQNEMRPPGNLTRSVDHSTMKLKSDIAKKWEDGEDMEDDLVQWFDASVKASGPDLGEELIYRLESTLERFEKINDAYLK